MRTQNEGSKEKGESMKKVKVKYVVEAEQEIEWPEDELDLLTEDNLIWNCDVEEARSTSITEILSVTIDGEAHQF